MTLHTSSCMSNVHQVSVVKLKQMHFDSTASELAKINVPLYAKRRLFRRWALPGSWLHWHWHFDSQTCNNQENTNKILNANVNQKQQEYYGKAESMFTSSTFMNTVVVQNTEHKQLWKSLLNCR